MFCLIIFKFEKVKVNFHTKKSNMEEQLEIYRTRAGLIIERPPHNLHFVDGRAVYYSANRNDMHDYDNDSLDGSYVNDDPNNNVRFLIGYKNNVQEIIPGYVKVNGIEFDLDDEDMVRYVSNNNRLKELFVSSVIHYFGDINDEHELMFDEKDKRILHHVMNNEYIENIYVEGLRPLDREIMCSMTERFLDNPNPYNTNTNNVQEITLCDCELGVPDMSIFASSLTTRGTCLNKLTLKDIVTRDPIINQLVSAFKRHNPSMFPKKFTSMYRSLSEEKDNFDSIISLLTDKRCSLEELKMKKSHQYRTRRRDDRLISFAYALVGNTSLHKFDIGWFFASEAVAEVFLETVCNSSSVNATYTSNHTLDELSQMKVLLSETEMHNHFPMWHNLNLNVNRNKKFVAREKVLMNHFMENFRMEEFGTMLPELLVRSIHFIEIWGFENDRASYAVAHRSILFQLVKVTGHLKDEDTSRCTKRKLGMMENSYS